jgi:hypothetical protein
MMMSDPRINCTSCDQWSDLVIEVRAELDAANERADRAEAECAGLRAGLDHIYDQAGAWFSTGVTVPGDIRELLTPAPKAPADDSQPEPDDGCGCNVMGGRLYVCEKHTEDIQPAPDDGGRDALDRAREMLSINEAGPHAGCLRAILDHLESERDKRRELDGRNLGRREKHSVAYALRLIRTVRAEVHQSDDAVAAIERRLRAPESEVKK